MIEVVINDKKTRFPAKPTMDVRTTESSEIPEIPEFSDLAEVAYTGDYNDLNNKPSLFSGDYNDLNNKPSLFSGDYNDLNNKPSLFSGDYNDLDNKPCGEVFNDTLLPGSIPSSSTLSGSVYCSASKLSGAPAMNEGYVYYLPEVSWYGEPKRYHDSTAIVTTLGNAALIKELAESDRVNGLNTYYNSYRDTGEDFCYVQYSTGSGASAYFKSISRTQNGISGVMYQREIEVKQLDANFVPEELNGLILKSATTASAKKFRITVDDSGTISATELT